MRRYIGLACTFHDPAVAVVDEGGAVLFAEATERPLQNKRAFGSPPDDINQIDRLIEGWCPAGAQVVVGRTWSDAAVRKVSLMGQALALRSWLGRILGRAGGGGVSDGHAGYVLGAFTRGVHQASVHLRLRLLLRSFLSAQPPALLGDGTPASGRLPGPAPAAIAHITGFDHHLTHAAAACFASPFESSACAILDGYGEDGAIACYLHEGGSLTKIPAPASRGMASLGRFYGFLCFACGFDAIKGEEWKVMGLAAYGRPDARIYDLLRGLFEVEGLSLRARGDRRYPALIAALRRFPAEDVAHNGQRVYEDITAELLTALAERTGQRDLVLGGGCALNSSFNGRILERTPFERLFVPPAPGDDGCALGAAWLAWQADHPGQRPPAGPLSPYLGSAIGDEALERLILNGSPQARRLPFDALARRAAELLDSGKVLGWMQGRAEVGPRALGNRSILADPRREDMQARLNARVKFREGFRPFAPAILEERVGEWFEDPQPSPYMERTLRFLPEGVGAVPAVVHRDGTGRVQTVSRGLNPRFHALLSAFQQRTGIPILLNTSFNVMGKPIIHSVEDAVAVFHTTGLDALAIGDVLVEKAGAA